MTNILSQIPAQWPLFLALVFASNIALSGFKTALEAIKDQTKTDIDNKVYTVVSKVAAFLSKALDVVGYNPKH